METRKVRSKRSWLLKAGLLIPGLFAGCHGGGICNIDNCATIPPGAIPAPPGTYLNKFRDVQAAKAEADDFVVYKHMWFMGGNELGPYGRYQVNEMVRRLPGVPYPIVIQPVLDNEDLNRSRVAMILSYMQRAGIPDPETRVVVAFPQAEGLYGEEAERIYGQLVGGQGNYGGLFGGGGGFGGTFGRGFGGGFGRGGFGRGFGGFGY